MTSCLHDFKIIHFTPELLSEVKFVFFLLIYGKFFRIVLFLQFTKLTFERKCTEPIGNTSKLWRVVMSGREKETHRINIMVAPFHLHSNLASLVISIGSLLNFNRDCEGPRGIVLYNLERIPLLA